MLSMAINNHELGSRSAAGFGGRRRNFGGRGAGALLPYWQGTLPSMNPVYRCYFSKPFPSRTTVMVAGLMVARAAIEIVAYAHLKR